MAFNSRAGWETSPDYTGRVNKLLLSLVQALVKERPEGTI